MIFRMLLKLANNLDRQGLFTEADMVDSMLKTAMTPEEYKRYYGKQKYEGSTVGKELDISTPEGYKKYFGKEMPQAETSIPLPKIPISSGDTLSDVIQDMAVLLEDKDYGLWNSYKGIKIDQPGSDSIVVHLTFKDVLSAGIFMESLGDVGFETGNRAIKKFQAGNTLKYDGRVAVHLSDSSRNKAIIWIITHAPDNERRKELLEAMRLARFYLDLSV